MCKTLIALIVFNLLTPISTIPLHDLDSDGHPNDFQIFSYACTGHYWFRQYWHNAKRRYVIDPPYSDKDHRYIQWSTSTNKWRCYKPDNNVFFRSCALTNLFDCNQDMAIRYQIVANQSEGWYRRNGTDANQHNYYHSETVPRRAIFYDTDASEWRISDEYNGNTIYATCSTLNFFECEWVHTGKTANPTIFPTVDTAPPTTFTISPTAQPTISPTKQQTTTSPTAHPTISPIKQPTVSPTKQPTVSPTVRPTISPTKQPTVSARKRPTLQVQIPSKPLISTAPPSYHYEDTIVTNATKETIAGVDLDDTERNKLKLMVYSMIGVSCCCVLCVVCAIFYKSKLDIEALKGRDHDVKVSSLIMNARPVVPVVQLPQMRDRVYSNSQPPPIAGGDDEDQKAKEEESDVDTNAKSVPSLVVGIRTVPLSMMVGENPNGQTPRTPRNRAITDPGMQIDPRMTERNKNQRDEFKIWMTKIVKLPEYYDVLVQNGYESLEIIKEVTDKNELAEIGIVLKGHRLKLMREIEKLKLVKD